MQILLKTLTGENGELFAIANDRRLLLAKCRPCIEIYEHSQKINTLGQLSGKIKTYHSSIVICSDRTMTREADADFLQQVSRFEFVGDFQREDGIFERIRFDNLAPDELDLCGDWKFSVIGQMDITNKLITF